MTRLVLLAGLALGIGACDKPSPDACRKALMNMQHLLGNESNDEAALAGEVRRCTGGSSKTAVECATKAQTLDELRRCEFYKVPASATTPGSAAPAGSAGSGSAK